VTPENTSDEAQIQQAVARFAKTYTSKWGPLAFGECDISPAGQTATAACRATGVSSTAGAPPDGPWKFSCRKAEGSWRIVSVQPPDQ